MVIALSSSVPLVTTRLSLASVIKGGYSGMCAAPFGSILHPAGGGGIVVGGGEAKNIFTVSFLSSIFIKLSSSCNCTVL